jgi:hypothetical protein
MDSEASMTRRLLWFVVFAGAMGSAISVFFLLPEWATLTASYQNYQRLAMLPDSTVRELAIPVPGGVANAEAAENRHRLNCFAEAIGVLIGDAIASIGIHGICTLSVHR